MNNNLTPNQKFVRENIIRSNWIVYLVLSIFLTIGLCLTAALGAIDCFSDTFTAVFGTKRTAYVLDREQSVFSVNDVPQYHLKVCWLDSGAMVQGTTAPLPPDQIAYYATGTNVQIRQIGTRVVLEPLSLPSRYVTTAVIFSVLMSGLGIIGAFVLAEIRRRRGETRASQRGTPLIASITKIHSNTSVNNSPVYYIEFTFSLPDGRTFTRRTFSIYTAALAFSFQVGQQLHIKTLGEYVYADLVRTLDENPPAY